MNISKSDIEDYLSEIVTSFDIGKYRVSARPENQDIYIDYVFTEEDAKKVLLSLTANDFSDAMQNEHPDHQEEILYLFGKDIKLLSRYEGLEETVPLYIKLNKLPNRYVIVISLHKQEYPLSYKFRQRNV